MKRNGGRYSLWHSTPGYPNVAAALACSVRGWSPLGLTASTIRGFIMPVITRPCLAALAFSSEPEPSGAGL